MAATNPSAFREGIFISYRRDDARGASGRVCDWLRIGFGRERVFRDVASIGAGKWREKIDQALAASKACVAVIGRRWADGTNLPRLQDPTDTVRYELETALASGERQELTVVPLLVEEAQLQEIPTAALPPSLQPLLGEWNVLKLTESGWDDDTRRLIEAIAAATGLPVLPDLEEWLALMTGAERGMAAQAQSQAQGAPMGGQRGEQQVLAEMLRRVAEAPATERPGLKAAFEAMAAGDSLLAEDMFEREVEASERLIAAASQLQAAEQGKKAEAAKNVGQLAVMRGDLRKAVRYFELALAAVPGDLETALQLGYAWIAQGSRQKAGDTFGDVITRARERQEERFEALGAIGQGDVRMAQGDGPGALAAYEAALAIAKDLAQRDPANTQWQRDLSVSHSKIGDVRMAQGDGPGALAAYEAALAIAEGLAQRDPANTQWQRDLSVSHDRIGNVRISQEDGPGALAAYEAALAIAEGQAQRDPANTHWQRDLTVSHIKVGDVRVSQGDGPGALAAYEAALAITKGLAQRDPANTEWQRDLVISQSKVADVQLAQGDGPGALKAYQAVLATNEELAQRDPANTQWQVDVAVSCWKLGSLDALLPIPDRRELLQRGREILTTLKDAGKLQANQDWIASFDQALAALP